MYFSSACETFTDFLGASAYDYKNAAKHSYYNDICVYMLSAKNPSATLTKIATTENFTNLTTGALTATYVLRYVQHFYV